MIMRAKNSCAQYVCFMGQVAHKIGPMQNAAREIIMRTLPWTLVKMTSVVRAARSPVIAAGANYAVPKRGDTPRSSSINCQE
jgi:hypothetical protein